MPNVVLDASTVVSAALKQNSVPEKALLLARSYDVICLSDPVIEEIEEVLERPKFRRFISEAHRSNILDIMRAAAHIVQPTQVVRDCRDRKDNVYLELALAGHAYVIVSGDLDLLDLDPWRGIRIVSPATYVACVEARENLRPLRSND